MTSEITPSSSFRYEPILVSAESTVVSEYVPDAVQRADHQSEADLERDFIAQLVKQAFEHISVTESNGLVTNLRLQIERLNKISFSDSEWSKFFYENIANETAGIIDKASIIQENHVQLLKRDDGSVKNIYLIDKQNIHNNHLQVLNQYEVKGKRANRYDVTILVNGLPLVHIELKRRGVDIREAFNQINRYQQDSFWAGCGLFQYVQIFVISNGTYTKYYSNTVRDQHIKEASGNVRIKKTSNSYEFTSWWADANNKPITDLAGFTKTFFAKHTLLNILTKYCVFTDDRLLLVMRPYQIVATERILQKIVTSGNFKTLGTLDAGGYVWHTTGSGKTLTSFKAARLATELDFIDKVFFVVDRKDLDYQTMKEYQRFSPDSVNGSDSTAGLKRNLEKDDNKIIVTTIQKLNNLMRTEADLAIYGKQVVFIFDECHRSQFGEAQKNLKKKFKKFYQFGFTGTPIFPQNALGAETTASVFGRELHSYVITDAIRDEKVLKFKVDYNDVRPQFKAIEAEQDEKKLTAAENKQALLHPKRIEEISQYILTNFRRKTHRLQTGSKGFNAMFAVSSVDAAKLYYETLKDLQKDSDKPLRVATIFSFAANEGQEAIGDIQDESLDVSALNSSAKEFLTAAIADYNALFKTSFSVDSNGFQNYYRDLAKQVKSGEIDLLIVVGMFLTGFDAPRLNTLFVDKNLRYHGLIQAYSRTNRIFDATKTFGNIVTFRDLEKATVDAITLFGDKNTKNVVLEKSYKEYMEGFTDVVTGEARRGFVEVVGELEQRFPDPAAIEKEADKKAFAKLFGEYLRIENVLQNFDEFASLRAAQSLDASCHGRRGYPGRAVGTGTASAAGTDNGAVAGAIPGPFSAESAPIRR